MILFPVKFECPSSGTFERHHTGDFITCCTFEVALTDLNNIAILFISGTTTVSDFSLFWRMYPFKTLNKTIAIVPCMTQNEQKLMI